MDDRVGELGMELGSSEGRFARLQPQLVEPAPRYVCRRAEKRRPGVTDSDPCTKTKYPVLPW